MKIVKLTLLTFLFLLVYSAWLDAATVTLSWTAPTTLANGTALSPTAVLTYNIYRGLKADCSDCVKINTGPIRATTYVDAGLLGGKIYYYSATAVFVSPNLESAKSTVL